MKRLESIITVIFLLMVCVASIQQAQSWNNDGVMGVTASNKQFGLPQLATVTEEERQQYQRRIAKSLDEFGARFKTVKTESEKDGGTKGKPQLQGALRHFETKLTVAQEQFENIRSARAEEWDGLKSRMDAAMGDLNSSYERASAQAKQSRSERSS
jgi:hypothetical protein